MHSVPAKRAASLKLLIIRQWNRILDAAQDIYNFQRKCRPPLLMVSLSVQRGGRNADSGWAAGGPTTVHQTLLPRLFYLCDPNMGYEPKPFRPQAPKFGLIQAFTFADSPIFC
ncbi:hypothetical protein CSKR_111289 [Clonorchis sinensis]|uniref:Uncharacterized protein n=1 Tax=Clonorchis sinensis TaxID=79923 RepID=A0A419PCY7_CLOSI|nr:hypothetical protein CSKR_111289 [Clonorchis sinensis]